MSVLRESFSSSANAFLFVRPYYGSVKKRAAHSFRPDFLFGGARAICLRRPWPRRSFSNLDTNAFLFLNIYYIHILKFQLHGFRAKLAQLHRPTSRSEGSCTRGLGSFCSLMGLRGGHDLYRLPPFSSQCLETYRHWLAVLLFLHWLCTFHFASFSILDGA